MEFDFNFVEPSLDLKRRLLVVTAVEEPTVPDPAVPIVIDLDIALVLETEAEMQMGREF